MCVLPTVMSYVSLCRTWHSFSAVCPVCVVIVVLLHWLHWLPLCVALFRSSLLRMVQKESRLGATTMEPLWHTR